MKNKDLLIIHGFLTDYRKDQVKYEWLLKNADIDVPLQHLCGKDEDAKEVRARILAETQGKIAELDRLLQLIRDETLNADFECKDGKVIFK